ncbi:pentalenene synthase [Kitasatospora sp. NPDC017646]|uniref:terpene synthase family protein n=1 Tax=Kitasatospora sp. NPDC017646 TaxID=3364024 RepID=UPI0037B337EA
MPRHDDWPRSFGFLSSEAEEAHRLKGQFPLIAAMFYPNATGDELDLEVDQQSWYFLFDDALDEQCGRTPERVRHLVGLVKEGTAGEASPLPLAAAFADMRRRGCRDMPEDWVQRSAAHWASSLDHHVHEARSRQSGTPMSLGTYLRVRRHTIGVAPVIHLAERLSSCVLPDHLYALPHLSVMREMTKTFIICDNDIVSLDKDEALGERNNLVLCLEREHGLSRQEAVDLALRRRAEALDLFTGAHRALLGSATAGRLDPAERDLLQRYCTEALQTTVRGAHDWHHVSTRYRGQRPAPPFHDRARSPFQDRTARTRHSRGAAPRPTTARRPSSPPNGTGPARSTRRRTCAGCATRTACPGCASSTRCAARSRPSSSPGTATSGPPSRTSAW